MRRFRLVMMFVASCRETTPEKPVAHVTPPPASVAVVVEAPPPIDAGAPPIVQDPWCAGADIDLQNAFGHCPTWPGAATAPDVAKRLSVRLEGPSAAVAAGARTDFDLVLTNESDTPLPVHLFVDTSAIADPRSSWEVRVTEASGKDATFAGTDPCGQRHAELAMGLAAMQMMSISEGWVSPYLLAHIVLAPHGRAHKRIVWEANALKWVPKKAQGGACDAETVSVPLRPGSYTLRVQPAGAGSALNGIQLPEASTVVVVGP